METNKIKNITIADNENYLRQLSLPVDILNDKDLRNDIAILEEYFKQSDITLALAAIQVGIPKRLIYLKNTNLELINRKNNNEETEEDKNYNEARILINPVIISREGLTEYWEACASCMDNTGLVERPYKIVVEYYDVDGFKHRDIYEGFESTVLSHEMDHLDGILHIDIAKDLKKMSVEERKKWRQTHGYKIISEIGNYDELKNKGYSKIKTK